MNWTITDGDIYVSKNGNDTTGDGSMSLPYASINKATDSGSTGNKIVIGSGVWREARGTSTDVYNYYGDNNTIFDYYGESFFMTTTLAKGESFNNIYFNNDTSTSSIFRTGVSSTPETNCFKFNNCIIEHMGYGVREGVSIYKTIVKSYYKYVSYPNTMYAESSTILKFNYLGGYNRNFYLNRSMNCIFKDFNLYPTNTFTVGSSENNIFVQINTEAETLLRNDTNVFGLDPKFNNELIGDYTLQPDSPCLFAGRNNAHIGPFGIGYNFDANSSEFTEEGGATFSQSDIGSGLENDIVKTSQTINGVTTRYFILNTDHTEGTIESEWIDLQTLYELNSAKLFANFIYNEDGVATGRADIDNNYTGEFPNQYDFEMKTALDEDDKDTATWQETIWNKELSNVSARFVKVKIYMKS